MYYGIAKKGECYNHSTYVWVIPEKRWFKSKSEAALAMYEYVTQPDCPDDLSESDLSNFSIVKIPNHLVKGQASPEDVDTTVQGRVMYVYWPGEISKAKGLEAAKEAEKNPDYFVPFEKTAQKDTFDTALF